MNEQSRDQKHEGHEETVGEKCDQVEAKPALRIDDRKGAPIVRRRIEGERVRRLNTRYAHLAQTASASAKIIANSMGKWRNLETVSQTPSLPGAPTLAPVHDGEAQDQPSDQ